MKHVIVEYSGVKLNPAARNIIRAFGLCLDLYIEFRFGKQEGICFCCAEDKIEFEVESDFFSVVFEAVSKNMMETDEAAKKNIKLLYQGLCHFAESEDVAIYEKELEAIVIYVSENLNVYYKGIQVTNSKWQEFNHRWKQLYGDLSDFHIRAEKRINSINLSETTVYKDIFEKSKTGVKSIDNAVSTLLDSLPDDAEKILDIGSGPGYVNRNIPVDHHVLAMDIDENILKDNVRPTCIGDITDIPLDDDAVDMVMACDVLEHIPQVLLPKAVKELKRISKKYIYIQVPNEENLADSIAQCQQCGNVWHVNFHKNTFAASDLTRILGAGWKCLRINFTGDVAYYYNDCNNTQVLGALGIDYRLVDGWRCPECGCESLAVNREYYELINDINTEHNVIKDAMPRYSELGILFCKEECLTDCQNRDNQNLFESVRMNTIKLDFSEEILSTNTFTRHEMVPMLIASGINWHCEADGYIFTDAKEIDNPWVMFLVPGQIHSVQLQGESLGTLSMPFSTLDIAGKEFVVDEIKTEEGEFAETIQLDTSVLSSHMILKLYIKGGPVKLKYIECFGQGRDYTRYKNKEERHLRRECDDLLYSWFVPEAGFIDFSEAKIEGTRYGCCVLDYVNALREKLSTVFWNAREAKQKVSFELQEAVNTLGIKERSIKALEEELQKEQESSHPELFIMEELLRQKKEESQLVIAAMEDKLRSEQVSEFAVPVLEELLREKEEENESLKMALFEMERQLFERQNRLIPLLKNQVYYLAGKVLRVIKQLIRKNPFLYRILVKMGVKKGYNQVKGKLKSGEKYE